MRIDTQLNGANFRPASAKAVLQQGFDEGLVHPDWRLEHDEHNQYDAYATKIIDNATGEFLGFIARTEAGVICKNVFLNKTHKVALIEIEGWSNPKTPVMVVTLSELKDAPAEPVEHALAKNIPAAKPEHDEAVDKDIPF